MHLNKIINVKARFKTLYETQVDDIVFNGETKSILEDVILSQKYKEINLFLAIEQGSSKSSCHTHVVLNPRVTNRAREWLVKEYPALIFELDNNNKISVDSEQYEQQKKYNTNLKEFLAPRLMSEEAKKVKKFGGRMKSYTQALGIQLQQQKTPEKNNLNSNNKKKIEKNGTNNTVKQYQNKIAKLKQ